MHYTRNGEYLAASHVTGPRHNLLQMRLGRGGQQRPMCERLPPIGGCRHDPLDEAALISKVLEGVAQANQRNNLDYCVTHIRYVENDTGPLDVFAMLALRIVERLCEGGAFIEQAASVKVDNALEHPAGVRARRAPDSQKRGAVARSSSLAWAQSGMRSNDA